MKQQRDFVTKRAPVSVLDLPGMERWLSDMAARGFFWSGRPTSPPSLSASAGERPGMAAATACVPPNMGIPPPLRR